MEYNSAIKKNESLPFGNNLDWLKSIIVSDSGIILSEVCQTEKDKYCMISPICGVSKIQQSSEYNEKEAD